MNTAAQRPVGVFDSGVGGLTNVRALMERLPMESIVYFGDTARVPYGVKSRATIEAFTAQIVGFMLEHDVKALVIACNTIAAVAGHKVRQMAGNMPVLDVISAGAEAALAATRNNHDRRHRHQHHRQQPTPTPAKSTAKTPPPASSPSPAPCSSPSSKKAGSTTK